MSDVSHAEAPRQLILEHELLHGQLPRVLLLHTTDRWYLGDFLRHASWLTTLAAVRPTHLGLATHRDYLPLFASDSRVTRTIDVATIDDEMLGAYDLVVIPSTLRPTSFSPDIKRGLYSWNDGWAYTRNGVVIGSGTRSELNYFAAAHHIYGQTALPSATPLSLSFTPEELAATTRVVHATFANDHPVIVYNPTASNPRTRRTSIAKEVENVLTIAEHTALIAGLRRRLPKHNIVIGSALPPDDVDNRRCIESVRRRFTGDPNIRSIFEIEYDGITTLRGFSVLLACDATVAAVGTSTGTNTHLAALVGLLSFSIERGADTVMHANWAQPGELPMGSFRWRNPSPLVGAYNIDWERKTLDDFDRIATAFCLHLDAHTAGPQSLVDGDIEAASTCATRLLELLPDGSPRDLVATAQRFGDLLRAEVHDFYTDFTDEIAYLTFACGWDQIGGIADLLDLPAPVLAENAELIRALVRDSMLHKLATLMTGGVAESAPESDTAIFRKIRVNAPLTRAELDRLHCRDEQELCDWLRGEILPYLREICRAPDGELIRSGWQHVVHREPEVVVKDLATNPASEYLTDEFTLRCIEDALAASGGLVPPSSHLLDNRFASARITALTEPGGCVMPGLFGGAPISETVLAPGWVDEQVDNYLALLRQGVFNFDITFKDLGISRFGVLMVADFSAFALVERCPTSDPPTTNLRTDLFHMGINELVRNGQYLSRFANGTALAERYAGLIERHVGLDLRPYFPRWEWGDQGEPWVVPLARRLREFVAVQAQQASPRPVYPLVNRTAENLVFRAVTARLAD